VRGYMMMIIIIIINTVNKIFSSCPPRDTSLFDTARRPARVRAADDINIFARERTTRGRRGRQVDNIAAAC